MIKSGRTHFHIFSIVAVIFVLFKVGTSFGTDLRKLEAKLKYYESVEENRDSVDAVLWRLYDANSLSNPKKAQGYLNNLEALHEKETDKSSLARVYAEKGRFYVSVHLFNLAANYYLKAYQLYIQTRQKDDFPYFMVDIGNVYWSMGIYDVSEKYYQQALEIFRKRKEMYGEAVILNNLGLISQSKKDYQKALEYFTQALELRKKLNTPFLIAHSYEYIGNLYLEINKKDEALRYLKDAFDIAASDSVSIHSVDRDIFSSLNSSISEIFSSRENYPEARNYIRKAIDENERHNRIPGLRASLYLDLSYQYYLQKMIDSSVYFAEKSAKTADEINDLSMKKAIFGFLAHLYSRNNDLQKSNMFFLRMDEVSDSIAAIDDKVRNDQLRLALETYDQEYEITVLREKNKKSQFLIYGISIITLLLISFITLISFYRKKSTRKLRELADSTFEGLFMHDKGVISEVNQKLVEMTGFSRDEITGSSIFRFFDNLDESKVKKIIDNEVVEEFEAILKTQDGDRIQVEVLSRPMELANNKIRVAAVRDISPRLASERLIRISEANLQSLINNTNDVIWSLDNDHRILSCNLNFQCMFESLTGIRPEKGSDFFEVLPPSLSSYFREVLTLISDTDRIHKELELNFGNIRRSFDVSLFKITLGNENTGVSVFMHDLTENHKLLEQLRESNSTKDKFFKILAHDLKNPFNVILGFSEILVTDFDLLSDKDKLDFIKNIREASTNTFELLENLLNWSRLEIGRSVYHPEINDLFHVSDEVIKFTRVLADAKNIRIQSEIAPDTFALFDRNMINTVLRNLISNAVKFTYNGGLITVKAIEASTGNQKVLKVSVIDTGTGISQENILKILSTDHHFITTGTDYEKGTGLGLILCHDFLKLHDSQLMIESAEGSGSTFSFLLKMEQPLVYPT